MCQFRLVRKLFLIIISIISKQIQLMVFFVSLILIISVIYTNTANSNFSIVLNYTLTHNGSSSSQQTSYCSTIENDYGYVAMNLGIIRKFNYKTQQIIGETSQTSSTNIRGIGIVNNFLYAYFSSDNKVKKFEKETLAFLSEIILNDNCLQAYFDKTGSYIYCSVYSSIIGVKKYSLNSGNLNKTTNYQSRDNPTLTVDQNSLFIGSFDQKNFVRIQNNGTLKEKDFKRILSSAGASGIQSMAISSATSTYFLGDKYLTFWYGNAKTLQIEYNHSISVNSQSASSIISIQVYEQVSKSIVITTAQELILYDKNKYLEYHCLGQTDSNVHIKVSPDKNYILRIGQKTEVFKIDCPTRYYYNYTAMTCKECDISCLTCDSITAYCTSCIAGYYVSTYYCLTCSMNCLTCNLTGCLTCNSSYYLNNSVCLLCDASCNSNCDGITGYCTNCPEGFYESTFYCLPCSENCTKCNAITCLNCSSGSFLNDTMCSLCDSSCNNSSCNSITGQCSSCVQGTYALTIFCLPCQQNCLSCNSTNCLLCQSSFYANESNCISCDKSCNMSCNSITGRCDTCNTGFYASTIYCLTCSTNCLECQDDTGLCLSCQNGYFLNLSLCSKCDQSCNSSCDRTNGYCTSCSQGYYQSTFYCLPCSNNCISCENNTGNCLSCEVGYFINGSTCQKCDSSCNNSCEGSTGYCSNCSQHYYESTYFCLPCQNNCLTCQNSTGKCLNCETGFYVNSSGNCNQCSNSCQLCLDISGDCIQCQENYYYQENISTFQCQPCGNNCLTCSNITGKCQLCSNYYYLQQYQQINCLACHFTCQNCDNQTGFCLSCVKSNYYINQTSCQVCPTQCLQCSSLAICTKCASNYQLLPNKTCQFIQEICPRRQYLHEERCIECTYLCETCDVYTGLCITCIPGFFLNGDQCQRCHQSCQECENKMDQCISCQSEKYTLKDGKCQEQAWLKVAGKAMSLPSMSQIKGARYGLLFCNAIWLYVYGNRTYYGPVKSIFDNAQIIEDMKWSFLGFNDQFLITENILPLSDYSSYSNKKHLQQQRKDDIYIKNCFEFWCFTIPQILITFFFAHTIVKMCSSFKFMKYFTVFSMVGYFFIMSLQENIQYLTYIAFNNFQMLFYFNFKDKIAAIFMILTFFILMMYVFAAYFLFKYLYKRKNQFFLENINNNLYTIIFFHFVIQCKYFLTGAIHSLLHYHYILQISMLGFIEFGVGIFCLFILSRAQMYKVKVFAFVMILDYFLMGIFCFLLNTTYETEQSNKPIRQLTDSIFQLLLYVMMINAGLKAILSFIPQHQKVHGQKGESETPPKTKHQQVTTKADIDVRLANPNKTKKLFKLSTIENKAIVTEQIQQAQPKPPSKSIFWQQKVKIRAKKFKVASGNNSYQIENHLHNFQQ